jgi:hypothetical protein
MPMPAAANPSQALSQAAGQADRISALIEAAAGQQQR